MAAMRPSMRLLAAALLLAAGCGDGSSPTDPSRLTRSEDEPPGDRCRYGGTAVHTGLDDDGDGVLDAAEVDDTTYVCSPAPVPTRVSRTRALPPGEPCPAGGTAVEIGPDRDGDGALDDDEVETTTFACEVGEVLEGDVTFADWLDPLRVAQIRQATIVTGRLQLGVDGVAALPQLRRVVGAIEIGPRVTGLDLPALADVGGSVDLTTGALGSEIELAALRTIGGELRIAVDAAQDRVAAPRLETIGGSLIVGTTADATARIELPALRSVGGTLYGRGIRAGDLEARALASIGGDLELADLVDDGAATLLPGLVGVTGAVTIGGAALTALELPALETAGDLRLGTSPLLTSIRLGALTTSAQTLTITAAPALTTLELPALAEVGTAARPGPHDMSVIVSHTALTELALPALRTVAGGVSVASSPALTAIRLPALTRTQSLSVTATPALTVVSAPRLTSTGYLNLVSGPLAELALDDLREIVSHLDLRGSRLEDLRGLPSVQRIGHLTVSDNQALTSFAGLTALRTMSSLSIRREAALASLDGLQGVAGLPGRLVVSGVPGLTSLAGLERITTIGDLYIEGNGLTSLDGLGGVTVVSGGLSIRDNAALASIAGLARLRVVGGAFAIIRNPALPAEQIAELTARLGR
jgi:hypothetical protein